MVRVGGMTPHIPPGWRLKQSSPFWGEKNPLEKLFSAWEVWPHAAQLFQDVRDINGVDVISFNAVAWCDIWRKPPKLFCYISMGFDSWGFGSEKHNSGGDF